MEQFRTEAFEDGTGVISMRITCTLCAASINFSNPRHAGHYRDVHAKKCKTGVTAKEYKCQAETFTPGTNGMYWVQCQLAAGHPGGPGFETFTDDPEGHIWPDTWKKSK